MWKKLLNLGLTIILLLLLYFPADAGEIRLFWTYGNYDVPGFDVGYDPTMYYGGGIGYTGFITPKVEYYSMLSYSHKSHYDMQPSDLFAVMQGCIGVNLYSKYFHGGLGCYLTSASSISGETEYRGPIALPIVWLGVGPRNFYGHIGFLNYNSLYCLDYGGLFSVGIKREFSKAIKFGIYLATGEAFFPGIIGIHFDHRIFPALSYQLDSYFTLANRKGYGMGISLTYKVK